MALLPRRPEHPNVLDIPTPPLQQAGLFLIFFFTALAFVVYSLRVYSRLKTRQWGLDDWMITCAMIFSLMMIGPFYMYFKLMYFGWTVDTVPKFDPAPGKWWFYLAQLFYNPILAFVKASVLLFLLRLGGQKPGVKMVIYGLMTFNGLQAIAIFITATLQCLPIEANWDAAVLANAKCIDNSFHVIISCLTILTDIIVIIIPFWIFLGLKMPRGAKIAVVGIFAMGLSVTIIGIVRLVAVYNLFYGKPDPNKDPYQDITTTLNVIESNVAIVTASAPALRPLFRSWLPKWFGGSSGRYGPYGPYGNKYHNKSPNPGSRYFTGGGGNGTVATVNGGRDGTGKPTGDGMLGDGKHGSIHLKSLTRGKMTGHAECRSISPSGSEEEIMTYNGIMRTTDVRVHYGDPELASTHNGSPGAMMNDRDSSRTSSEVKVGAGAREKSAL